ncbi:MAG: hypothetical protein AAFV26_11755 [Pseudomonadota bacterium]
MTATVIRLHEVRAARLGSGSRPMPVRTDDAAPPVDALDLCELAMIVRNRFQLPDGLSDDALIRSLGEIQAARGARERWVAAFDSTLGLFLSLRTSDFNGEMQALLALVPQPRH